MPEISKPRINTIDLIRGFAVLGILLMNITSFSQVGIAYLNPLQGAGIEGMNGILWNLNWLFSDMRFMSMFSMLFGAGVIIFSQNLEAKGKKSWPLHYRRMLLLLAFGMVHAYLIWLGDILVAYSICGMIVFLLRKKSIKTLAITAGILFSIPILLSALNYFGAPQEALEEAFAFWSPSQEEVNEKINIYRGAYSGQMEDRFMEAVFLQTFIFLFEMMWRVCSLMLLGMILFRTGFLSGEKSDSTYKKVAWSTLPVGLGLSAIGLYLAYRHNWDGVYVMGIGTKFNYIGSVPMAIGYMSLLILAFKSQTFIGLQARLMAAGRMAFTNYIFMSVVGLIMFTGVGFALMDTFSRLEMLLTTLVIWAVMLWVSPIILARFKQGPLEKFWRYLTYFGRW